MVQTGKDNKGTLPLEMARKLCLNVYISIYLHKSILSGYMYANFLHVAFLKQCVQFKCFTVHILKCGRTCSSHLN